MATKSEIIANTYKKYLGSKAQTLDRIKSDDKRGAKRILPMSSLVSPSRTLTGGS